MNFNLISPSTNGNDYVINFKDPITINENSKVSLNWVELQRKGVIVLEEEATITYTCNNNIPALKPGTGALNEIGFVITIPAGKYELSEFQDKIETLTDAHITSQIPRLKNRYRSATVENNNTGQGKGLQEDGKVGLVLETNELLPFGIDGANSHDSATATGAGAVVAYTTANNTGTYDNYANSDAHFDFYRAECPKDQELMNSYCLFQSIERPTAQTG